MSRIVCIPGVSTHRGEAMEGLRGLSPPKFVKVSPSITEDEYIYTSGVVQISEVRERWPILI